ncbi:MAG: Mut7-C RNAse domain-containing protein, partial [Cyclobacteriaceae bacterium]
MADQEKNVTLRFYEELNDFLPGHKRKMPYKLPFSGSPSIKDVIESQGVPHTEVDLILVNRASVDFRYNIAPGDRISVYPEFEMMDISPLIKLRPEPLRVTRFIADAHLGKLARYLRMCGFDTVYKNDISDDKIIT